MSKYQQVEYIESTGGQYINTGVTETDLMTVSCHLYNTSPANNYLYGSTQSSRMMYNGLYSNNQLEYNWLTINYTASNDVVMDQRIDGSNNIITINNEVFVRATGTSNNTTMYIFACNNALRVYPGLRLYYFNIFDNNVPVRHFIPCYRTSDNKIGLFDCVENKFYPNIGNGAFTKGPDITTNIAFNKSGVINSAGIIEVGSQVQINPLNYINTSEIKEC